MHVQWQKKSQISDWTFEKTCLFGTKRHLTFWKCYNLSDLQKKLLMHCSQNRFLTSLYGVCHSDSLGVFPLLLPHACARACTFYNWHSPACCFLLRASGKPDFYFVSLSLKSLPRDAHPHSSPAGVRLLCLQAGTLKPAILPHMRPFLWDTRGLRESSLAI